MTTGIPFSWTLPLNHAPVTGMTSFIRPWEGGPTARGQTLPGRVATREDSGVLCFHSRRGVTHRERERPGLHSPAVAWAPRLSAGRGESGSLVVLSIFTKSLALSSCCPPCVSVQHARRPAKGVEATRGSWERHTSYHQRTVSSGAACAVLASPQPWFVAADRWVRGRVECDFRGGEALLRLPAAPR